MFTHRRIQKSAGPAKPRRTGKALVFLVLSLPMVFGMLGLVVDGSLLMSKQRELQTVADAAAPMAAQAISRGRSVSEATQDVLTHVQQHDRLSDTTVTVNRPPQSGPFAGNNEYVEVIVSQRVESTFQRVFGGTSSSMVRSRSVAGIESSTSGGAIVILDPDPSPVAVSGLPVGLPALALPPVQFGGLEVLGLGRFSVQGGIFVNTNWGGLDQNGDLAGEQPPLGGLQHAVSTTPVVGLSKVLAMDIRVVGGVDNPKHYGNVQPGKPSPLMANKAPVPDPFAGLPVPTLAADGRNVNATSRGSVNIVAVPLLAPPVTLQPGTYDYINIVTGQVVFEPGVYVIRGRNPLTQISLSIVAGQVTAEGVMFYITDSPAYTSADGLPDVADGTSTPTKVTLPSMIPSVVINAGLLGSRFSGVNDPTSPYHGLLLFQRRRDRRPIVLVSKVLLGSPALSGTIYAKYGQLVFVGEGTYDLKFAVGCARIVNALDLSFEPSQTLPPVREVFLVE